MTRLSHLAIVSLSVLAACTVKSNSTNPDAGNYDGYYSETKDGGAADGAGDADDATTDAVRPKPRTVTSTKGAAPRKAKALSARKPPVTGGNKPRPPVKPSPAPTMVFDGFLPTNAAAGSAIEVFGSGFGAKGQTVVTIGNVRQKVIEQGNGHLVFEVSGDVHGPVVLTNAGRSRAKKNPKQILTSEASFHTVSGLGAGRTSAGHGLLANVYKIAQPVTELPAADALGEPFATFAVANLDIPAGDFAGGFQGADAPVKEWFAVHYRGSLNVTEAGTYELCLNAGDGALLFLDQNAIVDNDGVHDTQEKCESIAIEPGEYQLDVMWFQATAGELGLQLLWSKDGGTKAPIPSENLFPPDDAATMARK